MKIKSRRGLPITLYFMTIEVVTILLVTLLLTITFYYVIQTSLSDVAKTNTSQSVFQVAQAVENYTSQTIDKLNSLVNTISVNDSQEVVKNHMQTMMDINHDIRAIVVYDLNGNILEYNSKSILKEQITNNLSFDQELFSNQNDIIVTPVHVQNIFKDEYPWVVTIAKKKWANSFKQEVYISMDIQFSSMAAYIDEVGIGQHGYCFITNSNNELVYHPLQQLIYLGLKDEQHDNIDLSYNNLIVKDGIIYVKEDIANYNWKVVGVSYISELVDSKLAAVLKMIIGILVIVLTLVFIIIGILSLLITKPVRLLLQAMQSFEKNALDFKYQPVASFYEFNQLSLSFEHMVVQIQELMEQVRKEEIILRKTELKALQAQINPHFLYNTLDSIQWMCEQGKNESAVIMVGALAQLFRISISKGHELISIEKELQHVKSYLLIQSYRYRNQFTYRFEVEDEALTYLCNKITLQPIIENAIYHGISRMIDEGEIVIEVYHEKEEIIFVITDNGVGMTEKQVDNILKKELTDSKGIGVKNVNDRIKIYFGEEYGIHVTSELDVGTMITIRIPAITEEKYEI